MKQYSATHMIRMEHLNHHGNLYAGRGIEWMIESAFIAAGCVVGDTNGLLYKNTHKFDFVKPVKPGDIVRYDSAVVRTGGSSLTVRVGLYNEVTGDLHAEGYVTFVTINAETKTVIKHGLTLDKAANPQETKWREEAESFFRN